VIENRSKHRMTGESVEDLLMFQRDQAMALGATSDLSETLHRVLDLTFRIGGLDCGGVYLVDKRTGCLDLIVHRGLSPEFVERVSHYEADAPQTVHIMRGEPIYRAHPDVSVTRSPPIEREGLSAVAIIPVLHRERVIALLNLATHTANEILEPARAGLEALAAQIGGVISRVRVEEALKESQADLQNLFEAIDDFLFVLDSGSRVVSANSATLRRLGYSLDEIVGKPVLELFPADRREEAQAILEAMIAGRETICPIPLLDVNGNEIAVETRVSRGRWGGRDVLFGVSRDVTDRIRVEAALSAEHAFRESLIERASEGLCVCHATESFPHIEFTVWNSRMTEITGYTMEEINRLGWYQTVYQNQETSQRAAERMARMRKGVDLEAEDWEIVRADGEPRVLSISTSLLEPKAGPLRVLALMYDVSERRRAQAELQTHRERLEEIVAERTAELREIQVHQKALLDNIPDLAWVKDRESRFIAVNEPFGECCGVAPDQLVGMTDLDIWPHDLAETYRADDRAVMDSRQRKRVEEAVAGANGRSAWFETIKTAIVNAEGDVIGTAGIARDITDRRAEEEKRRQLETRLAKSQRLEAIGTLAGGIAHDFNNLLTGILGNISLARSYLEPGGRVDVRLVAAEKSSLQARHLTHRFLTFAEGGRPVMRRDSVAELLEKSAGIDLSGSNVRCECRPEQDLWPVRIDRDQMRQVLNNVITNAREAMPDGGTVRLTAENVEHAVPHSSSAPPRKRQVRISVTDAGVGIPEGDLGRLFDPYFTMKDLGVQKGMGLGLAIADSIVRKHGGFIEIESRVGIGTTVAISLPAALEVREPDTAGFGAAPRRPRVLIMDDEDVVREVARAMLESLGCDVESVRDGEEAIAAQTEPGTFDAIFLDLTVPGAMGGVEALPHLRRTDPDVLLVVASGYSEHPVMTRFKDHGFDRVLHKPFSLAEMAEIVRDLEARVTGGTPLDRRT
jgi:PAS domain S-box-containing protein